MTEVVGPGRSAVASRARRCGSEFAAPAEILERRRIPRNRASSCVDWMLDSFRADNDIE
jgi:hypothetical protein